MHRDEPDRPVRPGPGDPPDASVGMLRTFTSPGAIAPASPITLSFGHLPAAVAPSPLGPPASQFTDRVGNPRGQPHAYHRRHVCPALVVSLHVRPRERGLAAAARSAGAS